MKPFDSFLIVLSALTFALGVLMEAGEPGLSWLSLVAIGGGGYLIKLIITYFTNMAYYQLAIITPLCNKTIGSHKVALLHLLESVRVQEFTKAALVWVALLAHGPCSADEVAALCTSTVNLKEKTPVWFDVAEGLHMLQKMRLISATDPNTGGAQQCYAALAPGETLARLQQVTAALQERTAEAATEHMKRL
eukprot:TRINITY_DN3667_c0_g1_i1.p1 TRINITY_DN3667_c0_g1~~TRINITY_DN3667_c0_g1_i1.p1  ORF type:complete len:192 (+),score=57.16 TRINITY_DN3667_c0_g1_i1:157-732(+)